MSSSPPSLTAISANLAKPALPDPQRAKLADAARQFEAIFVRQMLAAARKADFGGEDIFGGQEMDTFRQMQDERFADIAAERGSFGLAKMIETQLAPSKPPRNGEVAVRSTDGGVVTPPPQPSAWSPSPSRGGIGAIGGGAG